MIGDIEAAERVVRRALSHYGSATDGDLTFVKYRENWVFRIDQADGRFAVRVHRLGYRSDAELLEELDLVSALKNEGVSVPVLRRTIDGRKFCHVPDDSGDLYQVDMLGWVDGGEPLGDIGAAFMGDEEVDLAGFHNLGALMAGLHVANMKLVANRPSVRSAWDHQGLVGDSPVWGDPMRAFAAGDPDSGVIGSAMKVLSDQLVQYGKAAGRYGPIHADLTPENVLMHDGLMTIIDFDDSGDGYYLFDLATAAFFYLPHPRFDDVTQALFGGYESVRALTNVDHSMWRAMLLARGLTYLGWATDRRGDETSDFLLEHIRPVVLDLAREVVDRASAVPSAGAR